MFLEYMNRYRLMTNAHIKGDNIKEQSKENMKARTGNYDNSQQK